MVLGQNMGSRKLVFAFHGQYIVPQGTGDHISLEEFWSRGSDFGPDWGLVRAPSSSDRAIYTNGSSMPRHHGTTPFPLTHSAVKATTHTFNSH
jgi:hypothetical protein